MIFYYYLDFANFIIQRKGKRKKGKRKKGNKNCFDVRNYKIYIFVILLI